jgi:predicted nucleotidyltransferase
MTDEDRVILDEFAVLVRRRYPRADIRAFGSRARGTADEDSDFDTCVILPRVDHEATDYIRQVAWETGFEHGCVITTIILTQADFRGGPLSESALVAAIRRQGVAG